MTSKKMEEYGSLVQELDATVYRKIASALASKQMAMGIVTEIERKKKEGRWIIGLWSREPEKAKNAIKEVLESQPMYQETTVKAPKAERETPIDVFDKNDHLTVVAEFPGIDEKDIKLTMENVLRISVNARDMKYDKEVSLPCIAEIIDTNFNNNVLEVRLKKMGENESEK